MKPVQILNFAAVLVFGVLVGHHCSRAPAHKFIDAPVGSVAVPTTTQTSHSIDALRRGAALTTEPESLPLARVENADIRRARNYPMQPPTIPHAIDGYQVDQHANRCMLCHGQTNSAQFQAPPVSVTHYMDRDSQVLAEISPRRYFCVQCHVVQTDAAPLVANTYTGADDILTPTPTPATGE
ncbi:MAG: nitrate reductase cytochrome c-type subunit [Rhodanobacteraceae bacterium]|nr:nitrate reductase cytochrome c-type subunit [Rhodanobacteraceae bacterium]